MFKASVLRHAQSCALRASSRSALTALSPALRAARTSQVTRWTAVSSLKPLSIPSGRLYSTATATATQDAEANSTREPGLITKFSDLPSIGIHENIVKTLTETMRYETMTEVQSKTIKPALAGADVIAQAKTGTGKTIAFLIPIIQRILNQNPDLAFPHRARASAEDIQAIVMSPTRELAEQIGAEARKLCSKTGIIVQTAVGGTQKREMLARTRRNGCHILIATPGRLLDILSDPTSGISAPRLSALVLDEADRMMDVGFERELREIVRYLPDRQEVPRQTLLFSATIPRNVVDIAREYVNGNNFEFVRTVKADDLPTHEKVPQYIVPVKGYENIFPALLELFDREHAAAKENSEALPLKTIVFLPTTSFVQLASAMFRRLQREHYSHLPRIYEIHSKLTQAGRTTAADAFRNAKSAIMFSSDVTARGMDFPNVSHVVQIGVPPDREQYIHRLGRTGRANKSGQGWLIVPTGEIDDARDVLPGLPIQRAQALLQSADHDLAESDVTSAPAHVQHVQDITKRTPSWLLEDTYLSVLGRATSKRQGPNEFVASLNRWVRHGWGWEEPPAVTRTRVVKGGLQRVRGLNVVNDGDERSRERSRDDERDGRRGGFGGGRGGGNRSFGQGGLGEGRRDSGNRGGGFRGGSRGGDRDGFRRFGDRERGGGRDNRGQSPSF